MFKHYFQQELDALKDLGAAFSKDHPAVAPMLSGPTADPDVERLLEGVAFLTALLRQKLDDEFPEVIHELMHLIWPHYLRPLPCASIVTFHSKPVLKESINMPAGVTIASVPVEGTACLFQTCYDVELHPLSLIEASLVESAGTPPCIRLLLELRGMRLCDWQPRALRFFLSGDYTGAADIYLLVRNHLRQIILRPLDTGSSCTLRPDSIKPVGYGVDEGLFPYPSHSFPGYRMLQEYFTMPEKFLFFDIADWERWVDRGEGSQFEILLELDELPFSPPRIRKDNFALFATPVINIFEHEADPIRLDHKRSEYLMRPAGANASHYQVYSVEDVVGFVHGTAEQRKYVPFELFNPEPELNPVYHTIIKRSPIQEGLDVYIAPTYPAGERPPESETLSVDILCTNGSLPESLHTGDICIPTSSSPEFVDFQNIRPATSNVLPPLGTDLLWRLQSHLSLNYLSLSSAENLKALLSLYTFVSNRDRVALTANKRRIAGIETIEARTCSRLVTGVMMRGQEIWAKLRQDHFASPGDLFLFGCVLDEFLASYASLNTYTQLAIQDAVKGDTYQWPARIGDHPLI